MTNSSGLGPHPLWWTCGSSPSAVRAATVQAKMLSGRYRTCWLRRHFGVGESGSCRLPGCGMVQGDTAHLLSWECPALLPFLTQTVSHLKHLFTSCQHLVLPSSPHCRKTESGSPASSWTQVLTRRSSPCDSSVDLEYYFLSSVLPGPECGVCIAQG